MKKVLWIFTAVLLLMTSCCISALADDAPAVILSLNGSTAASQEVMINAHAQMIIQAPGATGVRVFDPNRWNAEDGQDPETSDCWDYYDRYNPLGYLEVDNRFNESAEKVYAQARYDEYEDIRDWEGEGVSPWTGTSNIITLSLKDNGLVMAAPAVKMSGSSVTRGNWLTAQITNPQGRGEWYWADLSQMNEEGYFDWVDHLDFNQRNELAIDTGIYEQGTYRLEVFCAAAGYREHKKTVKSFIITGEGSEGAYLKVSKDTVETCEEFLFSAFVPQPNDVRLLITKEGDPGWHDRRGGWNEKNHWENWGTGEPGVYCLKLMNDHGETEIASQTVTVIRGEGKGKLSKPNLLGIPGSVTQGQALTGTFTVDTATEWIDMEVNYLPDHDDWETVYRSHREPGDENWTRLNLPADVISREGNYRVYVGTNAAGYEYNDTNTLFRVQKSGGESEPTLTVNGSTEDLAEWPSSTNLEIKIVAKGATAIRLRSNEDWEEVADRIGEAGVVLWRCGFGDGDHTIYAEITKDEPVWRNDDFNWDEFNWNDDVNWSGVTNTVKVHICSQGELETPTVTLEANGTELDPDNAAVTRGDTLTVTVAEQPNIGWIWAEMRTLRTDGDNRWMENIPDGHFDGSGSDLSLRIPTAQIPAGEYYLQIGADAENYSGKEVLIPLTIQEPEGGLQPGFDFSSETIRSNEGLNIYAWAPGAEHMQLEIRWDRDPEWRDGRGSGRDTERWDWGCGCGGDYLFTLWYWMPGEENPQSIEKTLHVQSDGDLDAPILESIPTLLNSGEGIEGSFQPVEGAEWYTIRLEYSENEWDWEELINEDRPADFEGVTDLRFDSTLFREEGNYKLSVSANAVGKDNGYAECRIQMVDLSHVSEELVVRVNGETDGSLVEAYLHQELKVTVEAPESVTAVRVKNSTSDWQYGFCLDETYEWNLGVHEGGNNTFLVKASTDTAIMEWWNEHGSLDDFDWNSLDWNMTGTPVTVNVIKYGDLEAPKMEFPNGTTVARGETLAYRISPVENAWGYGIQVYRVRQDGTTENERLIDMQLEDLKETLLTALPTDGLEPGNYRLYVDPRKFGWHGDQQGYDFTVTEAAGWQEEPVFKASKTEYLTQEPMIFSAWAPGAAEMRLCYEDPDNIWFETRGDTLVDRVVPNWEKVYRVMAYAYYPGEEDYEDGNWVQIGETLEINVIAPYGSMEASLEAPSTVRMDENWTMALTCGFKGTDGYAECYLRDAEGNLADYHFLEEREAGGGYTAVWQADANTLEPGLYYITGYVYPGAQGYALGIAEQAVTVSAGEPAGILTVGQNEAEVFENVEVMVKVPGATAVGIYDGEFWTCAPGDTMMDLWPMWNEGPHVFYGRYTTEPVNPEEPGFDWENVNWEGFTNAETVLVNPPLGTLEKPQFTVAESEAERGEEFLVTVTSWYEGVENVAFGAHLIPLDEEFSDLPWFGADENGIIRVSTLGAEPGEYLLEVSANAVRWYGNSTRIQVTVTETAAGARILVDTDSLTTGETFQLNAMAPGAAHLTVTFAYSDGGWESDPLDEDGDYLSIVAFTGETACTLELTLTAKYPDNSTETARKTITVTAPKGDLHPTILLPGSWTPGSNLRFTVKVPEDAQYVVWVRDPEAGEDEDALFAEFMRDQPTYTYELDYAKYGFREGKLYEIFLTAAGTGYNQGRADVMVSPRSAAATVLQLPAGLTEIDDEAFAGIAAEKIIVPAGVTRIGNRAFADCQNLKEMELPEGITFEGKPLENSGPVFVYGAPGSWLETYAEQVENLYFIPVP